MKIKTAIEFVPSTLALAVATALLPLTVHAQQAEASEGAKSPFKISGGVSYGFSVRTSDADTSLVQMSNAAALGLSSTNNGGRNQDDGNLNYKKGDVFTNAVTGFVDFSLQQGSWSGLVRLQGWHDFELQDGKVPWGHSPNGYAAQQPLSDSEARSRGKFSNAIISEAWVRNKFDLGATPVTVTLGNQRIGWRGNGIVGGPLSSLDPNDAMSRNRAGSFAEQSSIPIPAIRAEFKPRSDLTIDSFIQLGFVENQNNLCGTYLAQADRGEDGCNLTMVNVGAGGLTDRQILASNRVLVQSEIKKPGGSGQFGLAARWNLNPTTELNLSAARYHSRASFGTFQKSTIPGASPYAPGDPRNPKSGGIYPEGIRTFALEFKKDLSPGTIYGGVGYTPNRPLAYPVGEVTNTFVTPASTVTLFRPMERATAPGGTFNAWDRRKVSEWQLGGTRSEKGMLGAANVNLRAELNARYVHDLPDPSVLRYARPEVFGAGPVNGACAAGASATSCSNEGYVSRFAWGYSLQAVAAYPKAAFGLTLRPRIAFAHSVKGYSFDGLLKEGRKVLQLGVDVVDGKTVYSVGLLHNVGTSTYDNVRDRNYLSMSVSHRF